jgi:FkbM family methyltransferase
MYAHLELPNKTKFKIRLDDKPTTDTHMIYETWGHNGYTPSGFEIKETSCIIDIGAHLGSFTVLAAKAANQGNIYAYEPFPEKFQLLQENVKLNNLTNVRIFNLGVLGEPQTVEFFVSHNAGHSAFRKTDQSIKVQCTSLPAIFDDNAIEHCDYLKIDCEGAEYDILFNTPKSYFEKIGMIVLEYHDRMYEKKNVKELQTLLEEHNFTVTVPNPEEFQGMLYAKHK